MIGHRAPFGSDDLPTSDEADDLVTSLAMGRDLEAMAAEPLPAPDDDFATRVMAAIAQEPVPQPAIVAGSAVRAGRPLAVLAALGDAWRVAVSGGRPAGVRLQALAMVLVAAVAIGSILSAGGLAVVGALGWFDAPAPIVEPTPSPSPSVAPSLSPSPPPVVAPTPSPTPTDTNEPERTNGPDDTDEPEGTDDGGGGNSGPGGGG